MRVFRFGFLASALMFTGCLRHGTCDEEPENRFCRDAGSLDAGTRRDASADAGPDAAPPDAGPDAGPPDAGPPDSGPPDAGACGGCDGGVCEGDAGVCVECVSDGNCAAPTPACDLGTNACVACTDERHCEGEDVCDPTTNECVECLGNEDCGTDGTCRTDERVCSGGVQDCGACTADSDCALDHDCVPTMFEGASYGTFCLPRRTGDDCLSERPLSVPADGRTSLGGRTGDYCGVDEAATTCDALENMRSATSCSGDVCGPGGVCGASGFCTIACASAFNCLLMPPLNTCPDDDVCI